MQFNADDYQDILKSYNMVLIFDILPPSAFYFTSENMIM